MVVYAALITALLFVSINALQYGSHRRAPRTLRSSRTKENSKEKKLRESHSLHRWRLGMSLNSEGRGDNEREFENVQEQIAAMLKDMEVRDSFTETSSLTSSPVTETEIADKRNNVVLAVSSALFALALFVYQKTSPVSAVGLLRAMEADSTPINVAVCSGKPTVVEFYANWCENCKVMAPAMREMEFSYNERVNFITVDGSNPKNSELVQRFHVDGIPHLAFLGPQSEFKTALIGAVPKSILVSEINALVANDELPYLGFDAFEDSKDGDKNKNFYPLTGDNNSNICK